MVTKILPFPVLGTGPQNFQVDIPDVCPHCGTNMIPDILFKSSYDIKLKNNISVFCQCISCYKYFAQEYKVTIAPNGAFKTSIVPYSYKLLANYDLPPELEKVSPYFKEIYLQSLTAENDNLNQISGIGFRKSIEFLIKDFLIDFQKENKDDIIKMPLGQAIKKINSERIKTLATASVWLGNDETHYNRKYEDKDVSDMKKFIKALSYFISSELIADDANEFINQ